jgi:hypothetical protein
MAVYSFNNTVKYSKATRHDAHGTNRPNLSYCSCSVLTHVGSFQQVNVLTLD